MNLKYEFFEELHNLEAPSEIVPIIIKLTNPHSVVDVGCGLGTFLRIFKDNGIKNVLGIDGSWCNKELLFQNINEKEFIEINLEQSIKIDKYFDLVICLEVAEHLSEKRADSFVKDLVSLGNVILFSAAIPRQGGINHLNEKWTEYWEEKFADQGYIKHDILKSFFWNKKNIWWWYKQNMMIYTKNDYKFDTCLEIEYNSLTNVIHPEFYESKARIIETISNGKSSIYYYFKLIIKAILNRIGVYKK